MCDTAFLFGPQGAGSRVRIDRRPEFKKRSTGAQRVVDPHDGGDPRRPSSPDPTDIGLRIREYLSSVQRELESNRNPRLLSERSALRELLESYEKLRRTYRREKELRRNKSDVKIPELSEIYSVLYPDLYENLRDAEKNRSSGPSIKRNGASKACVPRTYRVDLQDTRQKEKDRFVRLVSSAPSAFHRGPPKVADRKVRPVQVSKLERRREDSREKEKDRLAKIFSSYIKSDPAVKTRTRGPPSAPSTERKAPVADRAATSKTYSGPTPKRQLVASGIRPTRPQPDVPKV